jgi:MoaA/NifB/PqqE/SkfB family radical SAM enzyme
MDKQLIVASTNKKPDVLNDTTIVRNSKITRIGSRKLLDTECIKINWDITSRCNYRCSYCKSYNNKAPAFTPLDKLKSAVDKLINLNREKLIITLSGGEPSIHPDYIEFISYLSDRLNDKGSVLTITNLSRGSSFYTEFCDQVDNTHNNISFKASFHYEFANANKFIEGAKILSSKEFDTHLSIMAHPEHIDTVKEINKRLTDIKNDYLHHDVSIIRQDHKTAPDERYTEEDLHWIKALYAKMEQLPTSGDETKDISVEYSTKENIRKRSFFSAMELIANDMNNFGGMHCNAGISMLAIDQWGNVFPAVCFRRSNRSLGNLFSTNELDFQLKTPVICPFKQCGCVADIHIPKFAASGLGKIPMLGRIYASVDHFVRTRIR